MRKYIERFARYRRWIRTGYSEVKSAIRERRVIFRTALSVLRSSVKDDRGAALTVGESKIILDVLEAVAKVFRLDN